MAASVFTGTVAISTGVSGLASGMATFLGNATSANLASTLTDETGTGAAVFANTPTLVTPIIGAATGTSVSLSGSVVKLNGISSVGAFGSPLLVGNARVTGQTGAVSSIATYTVGASDGSFLVGGNVLCTVYSSGSFSIAVSYTDESNTARTNQPFEGHFTSGYGTAISGAGVFEVQPMQIRAKAATTITILTSGTFTSLTYNAEGTIMQIA